MTSPKKTCQGVPSCAPDPVSDAMLEPAQRRQLNDDRADAAGVRRLDETSLRLTLSKENTIRSSA